MEGAGLLARLTCICGILDMETGRQAGRQAGKQPCWKLQAALLKAAGSPAACCVVCRKWLQKEKEESLNSRLQIFAPYLAVLGPKRNRYFCAVCCIWFCVKHWSAWYKHKELSLALIMELWKKDIHIALWNTLHLKRYVTPWTTLALHFVQLSDQYPI